MKMFLAAVLVIHGMIHFLGFYKAFGIGKRNQIRKNISKIAGIFWLLSALLYLNSAVLFFAESDAWWIPAVPALIFSQILIIFAWKDTKFGTIANVIVVFPLIIACAEYQPGSFKNVFRSEVIKRLPVNQQPDILTEDDLAKLPKPIQKYIKFTGAVGKEKIHNFRIEFKGQIKPNPGSDFLDFKSAQYNFLENKARFFYLQSSFLGIPFDGLHIYKNGSASMKIRIASIIDLAEAKGKEMNKGETVTFFNDICLYAPASLADQNIMWEVTDSLTVNAEFAISGNTVSATLFFNTEGELINFSSGDRYETADGLTFRNYRWTTPVGNYIDYNGRKIPAYGEAVWHKPEGDFVYGKFNLVKLELNCTESVINN